MCSLTCIWGLEPPKRTRMGVKRFQALLNGFLSISAPSAVNYVDWIKFLTGTISMKVDVNFCLHRWPLKTILTPHSSMLTAHIAAKRPRASLFEKKI